METSNHVETALNAVASRAPSHQLPDGGMMIVIPEGYQGERIEPKDPPRIKQAITVHDRDSFVAYVNRFKTDDTRIFAEPGFLADGPARMVAVIDYHGAARPDHGVHTVTYTLRYAEQWQRWTALQGRPLKQAEFAELIEESRADIVAPDAATLLDIVRVFKASKKVDFDSVVYLQNGDVRLGYEERTEQKGSSGPLPETMQLGIPVYFWGVSYKVPMFVRYRVGQGSVAFQLKIDRPDVIEDAAFTEMVKAVSEATSIDAYLGRR